jgi:hypothetical protein
LLLQTKSGGLFLTAKTFSTNDIFVDDRQHASKEEEEQGCDGGFQIFGAYPECIPFVDPKNYSVAWHMLAYGETKYVFEAFENAKRLAKTFPDYDILISISKDQKPKIPLLRMEWKQAFPKGRPALKVIVLTDEQFDTIPEGQFISKQFHTPTYKKMNRWRVKTQFEMVETQQYTYIIQLDSNLFLREAPCDPIRVVMASKSLFGWVNAGIEQRQLVGNFDTLFRRYKQEHHLAAAEFDHVLSVSGGFLVMDTRLFTSKSYQHYIEFVDATGLIFRNRLADQNIFAYGMNLLTYGQYMHRFSGYQFTHEGGWAGDQVYSNKFHPLWHQERPDPFCNATDGGSFNFDQVQEEYFWNNQYEIREKNKKLAALY